MLPPRRDEPSWWRASGRGVRVAVVDSGIHAAHPHVGRISGGTADCVDRIGHGTAVAAAIRERAPDAELYAVKIFDHTLTTSIERLERGIRWAVEAGARVVNLSLGTTRAEHADRLGAVVEYAIRNGTIVVAAEQSEGVSCWPGRLPSVVPVGLDWRCPRDRYRAHRTEHRCRFDASGYARPIPHVPLESNLKGVSFAVAAVSGFVARMLEAHGSADLDAVAKLLETDASPSRPETV